MQLNVIHNQDFLRNGLPDHCADIIIADPPYFKVKGEFDKVWPTFDDYLDDVDKWAAECSRLLSWTGTLIWYGSHRRIAYSQVILDKYFHLLNNCTIRKRNGIQAKLANADAQRSFFSNDERFLLYENSTGETGEGGAILSRNEHTWREGILRGKVMTPIVDYLVAERDAAGFTTEGVNRALHTSMAGHWFTRKSQWELPTKASYERLRALFNRDGGRFLMREYEDIRKEYDSLLGAYTKLRRPFQMEGRQTDVFDVTWDSGASSRFKHDTVKDLRFTKSLMRSIIKPGRGGGSSYPVRRFRHGVPGRRPAGPGLHRLRDKPQLRGHRPEETRRRSTKSAII